MRHEEYERRKRALEAQLQLDIELLREGHQAKLRALESLWTASTEAASAGGSLAPGPSETPRTVAPAGRRGQAPADVEAVLPGLPEEFDKGDVVRALGYEPPRSTLYRVFSELLMEKRIAVVRSSNGRLQTRYRKVAPPLAAEKNLEEIRRICQEESYSLEIPPHTDRPNAFAEALDDEPSA
jgi:hypothetical protein